VIAESQPGVGTELRPFYGFLEGCLRHKSEVVIFEAARAICNMRDVTTRELTPAVTVLQLFLSSSKPVLRFAAVRTLNKVAMSHPMAVTNCNIDMESLIADPNRSIATLAITTLLKTGNESSIDRLLKQIGGFMGEIADEFKVVVVEAIKALCLKFPQKYRGLMNFLSNVLREDGGFEYKKAIVDAILVLIRDIPEAKEMGLAQLCEFIEDCEFTFLSVQILHLLGEEGPRTKDPARYIRYIYNRVILENATVRAAALSSLARFGAHCPDLLDRVILLLKRALYDNDDEVRDRATLYLYQLQRAPQGADSVDPQWRIPAKGLEAALQQYLDAADQDQPFDLASVPEVVAPSPAKAKPKPQGLAAAVAAGLSGPSAPETHADEYAEMLKAVPQLAALGPVFKTCAPVQVLCLVAGQRSVGCGAAALAGRCLPCHASCPSCAPF
jgi:coatomer protein complex subunit gamma